MGEVLIVLTLFKNSIIISLLLCTNVYANQIYISQAGTDNDNTTVQVSQDGEDNEVRLSIGGSGNELNIFQYGKDAYVGFTSTWGSGFGWGGDLDGNDNTLDVIQLCNQSTCLGDRFEFHIQGSDNDVAFAQGYNATTTGVLTSDDLESGGHFVRLDIHGNDNKVIGSQRASGDRHSNITYIYGNDNDVYTKQEYNSNKSINLTINNNDNDVDIIQSGNASHSATIGISGSYGTDLDLLQYSSTAQTYSLTQNCQTAAGCSVSVTQE
jgi:hypothetical protein